MQKEDDLKQKVLSYMRRIVTEVYKADIKVSILGIRNLISPTLTSEIKVYLTNNSKDYGKSPG